MLPTEITLLSAIHLINTFSKVGRMNESNMCWILLKVTIFIASIEEIKSDAMHIFEKEY